MKSIIVLKENKILFTFCLLLGVVTTLKAQDSDTDYLFGVTNKTANYVYMFAPSRFGKSDTSFTYPKMEFRVVKQFVIGELTDNEADLTLATKELKIKPVSSVKELNEIVPQKILASFKEVFNFKTDEDALDYFRTHNKPDDYPIFYKNKEIKIALGHLYEDKDVSPGKKYNYKFYSKEPNNTEIFWGESWLNSGAGNFVFEDLNDWSFTKSIEDSSLVFTWSLNLDMESLAKLYESTGRLTVDVLPLVMAIPTLDAKVYVSKNGTAFMEEPYILMNNISSDGDSLFFKFYLETNSNQFTAAYLRLTDEIGNMSEPSDTAWAYSITSKDIPVLKSIRTSEIKDGVRISWDALPAMPYISGVLITRSVGTELEDTLAFIGPNDTSFIDNTIEPSKVYTYYGKALYTEGVSFIQEMPAKAVGQYTKFTIPEIPNNLKASNQGANILLEWDKIKNPGIFGYYIFKGTHPNKIELYKGPILINSFIDSAESLYGGSVYYYQIRSENLMQDVSELSEYVSIKPDKPVAMRVPESMSFYYNNGAVQVSWNDIRLDDKIVKGYQIKRYLNTKEGASEIITNTVLEAATYVDTTYQKEKVYLYCVAPVSIYGQVGAFSEPLPFLFEEPRFDAVYDFKLNNILDGIMVSIPSVDFGDQRTYIVYRRTPTEEEMKPIATLALDVTVFIDKTAQLNQDYVYAIKIKYADGKLGPFGSSISLRRSN